MSELWICREQTARHPFYVESLGIELYNLEELCYYLYENAVSLEEGLFGEALFQWLGEELGMPRLAEHLAEHLKQGRNDVWCAWFFLQEIGMYQSQELEPIRQLSQELLRRDGFWRGKLMADRMLENGRYHRCIQAYERLLKRQDAVSQVPELLGEVWHNLGVAHARLFLFQDAVRLFDKAYQLGRKPQSQEAKEAALKMQLPLETSRISGAEQNWGAVLHKLREDYKKKVM